MAKIGKMAKRKTDKIKQFRGDKRARQAATKAWMLGNVGSIVTWGGRKMEPLL